MVKHVKNVEVMDMRMLYEPGQRLNIYILLKCFFNFKFSIKEYLKEYVRAVNPQLLITLTDNYPIFYHLSGLCIKRNWMQVDGLLFQQENTSLMTQKRVIKLVTNIQKPSAKQLNETNVFALSGGAGHK